MRTVFMFGFMFGFLCSFSKKAFDISIHNSLELDTVRIEPANKTTKNRLAQNTITNTIENKLSITDSSEFKIVDKKDKVEINSDLLENFDSIKIENIPEFIARCQRLYTEGYYDIADKGFQKIERVFTNHKDLNKLQIDLYLFFNSIYYDYIDESNLEGKKKKDECINNIITTLGNNDIKVSIPIMVHCNMILMKYYKGKNELLKAIDIAQYTDSIFKLSDDKRIYFFYPRFLYTYFILTNNLDLLKEAIVTEEKNNIYMVSYDSYIILLKALYSTNNTTEFEFYINKFNLFLESEINNTFLSQDMNRQDDFLTKCLFDIDMLIYFSQTLKLDKCINSLYGVLYSLKDLEIGTYKYLKKIDIDKTIDIDKLDKIMHFNLLVDSIYKISTKTSLNFNDNKVLDDLLIQLNLDASKLMLDRKIKLVQFDRYNLDSIRLKLKPNECFIFNHRDYYVDKSERYIVLKYDSLRFGFLCNNSEDSMSLIVSYVYEHSPAYIKLKPNDKIIKINNIKNSSIALEHEIINSNQITITFVRGLDTLTQILKRDSVFQEYLTNYENFIIIFGNQKTTTYLRNYIPISNYDKILDNYHSNLMTNNDTNTFYSLSFDKLYPFIKNYSTVYYSFAHDYTRININWLINPIDTTYLSTKHDFYNCTNISDFYILKNKQLQSQSTNRNMVIFANPSLNINDNTLALNNQKGRSALEDINYYYKSDSILSFSNLPYTEAEAGIIKKIGENRNFIVTSFLKDECSESNIKQIHSPMILHIATHGYLFNNKNNLKTNINPYVNLFKTALIFSEYNKDDEEDGILTAYEILSLDLKNTELVVLSACESANGDININGNSSNSLQRAFRLAGAKAVLASKWKVPDKQTQELMVEFYTNWLEKKKTKHKALQQAQLTLSKKYPEPYYWAAWVLYGE